MVICCTEVSGDTFTPDEEVVDAVSSGFGVVCLPSDIDLTEKVRSIINLLQAVWLEQNTKYNNMYITRSILTFHKHNLNVALSLTWLSVFFLED